MKGRLAALGWLGLVLLIAVWLGWQSRAGLPLETDLIALLPVEQTDPGLTEAQTRIKRDLARRVVFLVGAAEAEQARRAAARLRDGLHRQGLLQPGEDVPEADALRRLGAAYFPHRAGLLAEADRQRLLAGEGEALVGRALSQLYGIGGMADARLLAADPFLLFPSFLTTLPFPATRLSLEQGWLTRHEEGMVWVLVSGRLAGNPQALDDQHRFVSASAAEIGQIQAEIPSLRVLRLGSVFYAEAAARQGMDEASLIGGVSALGTLALILLVFRGFGPLLLGLVLTGTAMVVATAATLLLFDRIHVAALGFGGSLIGVSIDYALIYFVQRFAGPLSPGQRLARVWVGVALGLLTTLIGYAALALAPLPGLRQVAWFSAVGLIAAFVTVILWFPRLDRAPARPMPAALAWPSLALWRLWDEPRLLWWRRIGLGLLLLATGLGASQLEVDDDIRHQQALDPILKAEQAELVGLTGLGLGGQGFVIVAGDTETALRQEEALGARLAGLALGGWRGPARFVPSAARQAETQALVKTGLLEPYLAAYRDRIGLPASTPPAPTGPLLLETIQATGALPLLDLLVIRPGLHLVMLDPPFDPAALRAAAAGLEGVHFLDPTADLSALLAHYRERALLLLALSVGVMLLPLVWRYGGRGGGRVLLPPLLAVVLTPPLLALAGVPFSFFAAMALVLVLAIGVDYAVFCAEAEPQHDAPTLLATLLSALTTQVSFGLMIFSAIAGLRGFGATMLLGLALAVVFAPYGRGGRPAPRLGARPQTPSFFRKKRGSGASPRPGSGGSPILLVLLLLFSGCTPPPPAQVATLAPGVTLDLSAAGTGPTLEADQMVTARRDGETFVLTAVLSSQPGHLLLIATDPLGRRALRLEWQHGTLTVERAPWVPETLPPANVLADLMLMFWPAETVRTHLTGAELIETPGDRRLRRDGTDLIVIQRDPDPWNGGASLDHRLWHYALTVHSHRFP